MDERFNYNEYDQITVTTKTEKAEKIVGDYACFGWEKIDEVYDKVYSNVVHLTFMRAHRLKEKDELLYLQVCYEEKLNAVSDLERSKNAFSSVIFCVTLILAITAWVLGATLIFKNTILWGIVIASLGVLITSAFLPVALSVRKKENLKHFEKVTALNLEIESILEKVLAFGVENEK